MQIQKVVKCKVVGLTKTKQHCIETEHKNLQTLLQLESQGVDFLPAYQLIQLHSANKQQALRFYKHINPDHEYALSLRNDLLKVEFKPNNKVAQHWAKIPNKSSKKLWVAIKPHIKGIDFSQYKLGESILFRKEQTWWLYITVTKEVKMKESYSNVVSIDLGSKVMATVCGSQGNQRPVFLGREVRGIQRHYQHLRTELGKKKLLEKIKQLSDKEQRTVNDVLHKTAKQIVAYAEQTDSYIILGDLKGIRKSANKKGRNFRRIVSNMPYLKLTQYIEYKAKEKGIKVVRIDERWSSQTCSKCGYADKANRKSQGLFKCKSCGHEINADVNGCRNILKCTEFSRTRACCETSVSHTFSQGYMPSERAVVTQPQTLRCIK